MYEYISGDIIESNPAYVIVDNNGIGYFIHISLNTYSILGDKKKASIFIHQVIREDANILYGFIQKEEREIFRQLISVSGVGASTARMILSSLSPKEIVEAITGANVNVLKNVKGIGAKSAQRIIVDLKDKIGVSSENMEILSSQRNTIREESLSALVTLGFAKKSVEKILDNILKDNKELSVEDVIKLALKQM